jgi:hypothetical protein
MKIDTKTIKPILQPKKDPKVTDPPRFPKIINSYEDIAKKMFAVTLGETLKEMTDVMIKLKTK